MDFSVGDLPADTAQLRRFLAQHLGRMAHDILSEAGRWQVPGPTQPGPQTGHLHPVPELFIQVVGSSRLSVPGAMVTMDAGSVLVVPPRLVHSEFPNARFANLVLKCDANRCSYHLRWRSSATSPFCTVSDHLALGSASLSGHLDQACNWRQREDAMGRAAVAAHVALALIDLRMACAEAGPGVDATEDPVERCRTIVAAQAGDPELSPRTIARECNLSTDHLTRLLRAAEGLGLAAFLRRERLRLAARLLGQPGWPVADVARAAGFRDPGYFSRCWRAAHGRSAHSMRRS